MRLVICLVFIFIFCNSNISLSQKKNKKIQNKELIADKTEGEAVVITNGSGDDLEIAIKSALRNAIETVVGAFVSSKTNLLNDELVLDEICSISSGNIKDYKVLNQTILPSGKFYVTIQSIISAKKLSNFVTNKGGESFYNGELMVLNIKQQLLNEESEFRVISNLIETSHEILQQSFDYSISQGEIKSSDGGSNEFNIPFKVQITQNKNYYIVYELIKNTIEEIAMSEDEINNYKTLNKDVFPIFFDSGTTFEKKIYFRSRSSLILFNFLSSNSHNYLVNYDIEINGKYGKAYKISDNVGSIFLWQRASYDNKIILKLTTPSRVASRYIDCNIKCNLDQLNTFKGISVKPIGVNSYIRNGGLIIHETEEHYYIANLFCISLINMFSSKESYPLLRIDPDKLFKLFNEEEVSTLGFGYNDWQLPFMNQYFADPNSRSSDEYFSRETYNNQFFSLQAYMDMISNPYALIQQQGEFNTLRLFYLPENKYDVPIMQLYWDRLAGYYRFKVLPTRSYDQLIIPFRLQKK